MTGAGTHRPSLGTWPWQGTKLGTFPAQVTGAGWHWAREIGPAAQVVLVRFWVTGEGGEAWARGLGLATRTRGLLPKGIMSRWEWGSGLHGCFQLSQARCPACGQLQAGAGWCLSYRVHP